LTTLAVRSERLARAPTLTRLQRSLMWLVGVSGGVVFIEPAPYEFMVILAMVVFAAIGLSIRLAHLPLIFLLIAYNAGYLIGVLPVTELPDTVQWTAVSMFISITTLFFALALVDDTERRLDLLLKGYLAIAVMISIFGIITYFHLLPGSDTFMWAGRSRSTFKDPNVLGAFLVLPAVLAVQKTMTGRAGDFFAGAAMSMVLVIELLLAFSRGAWGAFAVAVVLMLGFSFLTAATGRERRRIVLVAILGSVALAAMLLVILSVPQISELFQERARFTEEYDTGRFGRFGRHILGAELALDHPWGIGPLQFSKYFPEDPHNSFLDSFMAGGWLSGTAYLGLILVTLIVGLQHIFVRTPWRTAYIALYATFAAETGESYIIDVQHWRHYFMIIGALWGLFAAAAAYRRGQRGERAARARAASPALAAYSPQTRRAA
jgi:O-antigen ligase/polysaccharide polymerase Wzy-like membrane protein